MFLGVRVRRQVLCESRLGHRSFLTAGVQRSAVLRAAGRAASQHSGVRVPAGERRSESGPTGVQESVLKPNPRNAT